MTHKCARCSRPLKKPSPTGYGPVCARAVLGAKPRAKKREPVKRDSQTADLFEVRDFK